MLWPLVALVLKGISLLEIMLLLAVLSRWAGVDQNNVFVRLVRAPTDPLLKLVRPLARKIPGPVDWSPMLVFVGLEGISRLLTALFR